MICSVHLVQTGVIGVLILAGSFGDCIAQSRTLRTAAEVQRLTATEASSGLAVRLQGVVTFTWHTGTTEFTLDDGTGAVWCPAIALPFDCRFGTKVEIEGTTDSGYLGPFVHALAVRLLGQGVLPVPRRSTLEELLSTQLNGRRVEIAGIIRGQRMDPEMGLDWFAFELATGGGRVTANVTHEATGHPELIDAEVLVRGVNLHATDPQQQAFLPMIYAHDMADIQVITPANPNPFDQPPTPLADIMRSTKVAGAGHRVLARGVVTYVGTANSFYVQDGSRGTEVFSRESLHPVPGETIDVVGFPEPGAFSPVLRDADWRPTGNGRAPTPLPVTIVDATRYDGRLINIQGRLSDISSSDTDTVLLLKDENHHCRVRISKPIPSDWRLNSILRATGVCSVEIGDWELFVAHRRPIGFWLLVQDPRSIETLQAAPWWNLARVAWLLAFVAAALCCISVAIWWHTTSRLKDAARTRDAAKAQFAAVLAERTRIAREIHDTLAQGLTGISANLEVLIDRIHLIPSNLHRHLEISRTLVRHSLDEARRSVWNLRPQALEEASLHDAVGRLGHQLVDRSGIALNSTVSGDPRPLPSDVETNLLRICQEAITNAVRHAHASSISVSLSYLSNCVCLEVCDDGKGIEPCQSPPSIRGGFGLAGMHERADTMHAILVVGRRETGGTRIELTIPHV